MSLEFPRPVEFCQGLFNRCDLEVWDCRVDGAHSAANCGGKFEWRRFSADHQPPVPPCDLIDRIVERGVHRPVTVSYNVSDDTDHCKPLAIRSRQNLFEAFAKRAFGRPEAPGHGLADHGYARTAGMIFSRKQSPLP